MNVIKREWQSYAKATSFWAIGILALLFISFYKMQGLSAMPGGVEEFLDTLPPVFQLIFKTSADMNTAIGIYGTIHLYMVIAFALHAALLGTSIFAKEERDKTFEFLYVKGMKRTRILMMKLIAAVSILLLLDMVCIVGVYMATCAASMHLAFEAFIPFLGALFFVQLFFFSFGLLFSLLPIVHHKAGACSCGLILVMFLMSIYVKLGGHPSWLQQASIFYYTDTDVILRQSSLDVVLLLFLLFPWVGFLISLYLHEHKDLLS